mmetsp:Transcript_109347/g.309324  ORF Transcript_109347/g.309324 Transcript_109347/m.309324 type:complete len:278 (-) Transcript_109347:661-1494(-)
MGPSRELSTSTAHGRDMLSTPSSGRLTIARPSHLRSNSGKLFPSPTVSRMLSMCSNSVFLSTHTSATRSSGSQPAGRGRSNASSNSHITRAVYWPFSDTTRLNFMACCPVTGPSSIHLLGDSAPCCTITRKEAVSKNPEKPMPAQPWNSSVPMCTRMRTSPGSEAASETSSLHLPGGPRAPGGPTAGCTCAAARGTMAGGGAPAAHSCPLARCVVCSWGSPGPASCGGGAPETASEGSLGRSIPWSRSEAPPACMADTPRAAPCASCPRCPGLTVEL